MKVVLFIAADYANREQSGKINVLGIFNRINAPQFPYRHRTMYLVAKIQADLGEYDETHDMKLKFFSQDGTLRGEITGNFSMTRPANATLAEADLVLEVGDVIFEEPGRYDWRLIINKDEKAVIAIDVGSADQANQAAE